MTSPTHRRLAVLDTCALSDALDRLKLSGAVAGLRRFGPRRLAVGRATTVALARGPGTREGSHLGTSALASSGPEHVIVVANDGRCDGGAWGGLLTLEAHLRHVAGIVVDGALRDVDEVDRLDVPVFARSATPRSARGRSHERATGVAVTACGVHVEPGAWVVADGSGVVFFAERDAERVIAAAEEIAAAEARMAGDLRRGEFGTQVLGPAYERLLDAGA
ncbi:MAG TPA: RraA family protein [Gemmatimonadales bacterium]